MGFLLKCPSCGDRDVYEFSYGGEHRDRPDDRGSLEDWLSYIYTRKNEADVQKEWWYHRYGCKKWFQALRDARNNDTKRTFWPGEE